jgi:hypothetical protein
MPRATVGGNVGEGFGSGGGYGHTAVRHACGRLAAPASIVFNAKAAKEAKSAKEPAAMPVHGV